MESLTDFSKVGAAEEDEDYEGEPTIAEAYLD